MAGSINTDEVEAIVDTLRREFPDTAINDTEVRREVYDVHSRYCDVRIRQFVPILVYRESRESLRRKRATQT